jgi:uncharacterized protein
MNSTKISINYKEIYNEQSMKKAKKMSNEFEWDKQKADKILKERGIDFSDVALMFDGDHLTIQSDQNNEYRWLIIGNVNGECVTGVYTLRGEKIRVITARRSRKNEQRRYNSRYA